jgi:hypothetical protein
MLYTIFIERRNIMNWKIVVVPVAGILFAMAVTILPPLAATPNTPSDSLLLALQDIQEAIASLSESKEGYWEYFEIPADSNQVLVTVPAGKQFVLRELYCPRTWLGWQLNVDDEVYFKSIQTQAGKQVLYIHNFPDECVAFGPGTTLTFVNNNTDVLDMTVVGYFRDAQ